MLQILFAASVVKLVAASEPGTADLFQLFIPGGKINGRYRRSANQ